MERLEEPSPRLRYFAACSVPLLLNATFLAALIYKLQYAPSDYSWFNVFAPFAAADLWTMLWRRDQLVDCLGSLCTKACVCLHLAGHMPVRLSAVAMCVPLWLSVLISSYYRIAVGAKTGFSVLVRSLYHLIFRVLQPLLVAMQLDGAAADWVVVLTPAWAGLVVCFSGALFLLYCAPVIRMHSLQELQAEATVLLFLCCLHLLCISLCGFLFVFWLAEDLDSVDLSGGAFGKPVPAPQIIAPLLVLQLLLAVLQPAISFQSRKFQLMTQMVNADGAVPGELLRYSLRAVRTNVWLCRYAGDSGNCLYRSTQDSYARLGYWSHDELMGAIFALAQADETNILLAVNFDKTMQHSVDDVRAPILANSDQIGYGSVALVAAEMGEVACRNRLCDALDSNISAVADVSEEESCIICYSNIGDMCLMNCGHGGICRGCASTLATEKSRQCPVCRGEISRVLHVGALFFWLKSNVGVFYSSAGYDVVVDRADSESDEDTAL